MEKLKFLVLLSVILTHIILPDLAVSIQFISEPVNVTVPEGESIRFNCTRTMSDNIAIWIIDGVQYYWADFRSIDQHTFDRSDNSLTISNVPRTLDGTSYQCVLNQQQSKIGYLTVLYELSSTPVPTVEPETTTSDVQPFTSTSPLSTQNESSSSTTETPPTSISNQIQWPVTVIASASVAGIVFISAVCCSVICILQVHVHKSKSTLTPQLAMVEHFDMVKNDIYETKAAINMTRNSAYSHPTRVSQVMIIIVSVLVSFYGIIIIIHHTCQYCRPKSLIRCSV